MNNSNKKYYVVESLTLATALMYVTAVSYTHLLTYAESVSMEDSKKQLAYFFTKLRRKQEGLKYIWVLEFQGNGNIHYHILTNLKIDIDTNSCLLYTSRCV